MQGIPGGPGAKGDNGRFGDRVRCNRAVSLQSLNNFDRQINKTILHTLTRTNLTSFIFLFALRMDRCRLHNILLRYDKNIIVTSDLLSNK